MWRNRNHAFEGEKVMNKSLLNTIFNGVGMAMGIATLVMSILGGLVPSTAFAMLALGVACLGIANLQK
jgi:hypothetical protein